MSRKFYATVPSDGLRVLAFVLLFVFCIGLLFALTIPSKGAIEPWLIIVTLALSTVGIVLWSQVGCYVSSDEIEFRDMFRRRKTIAWRDLTAVESEADAVTLRAGDQHIRLDRRGDWPELADAIRPLIPARLLPSPSVKPAGMDMLGEYRMTGYRAVCTFVALAIIIMIALAVTLAIKGDFLGIGPLAGFLIFGVHAVLILSRRLVVEPDCLVVRGALSSERAIPFSNIRRLRCISAKTPYWEIEAGTGPMVSLLGFERADDIARFIATKLPETAEYVGPGPI